MSISSYDYYRTAIPGWGTTQFQFRAPPEPVYQPRPTWSGWDYYRAHTLNPDPNLYYTIMNRTRDFGPTAGVGTNEARVWQRRVYSGLVNLTQLLPADIGVAAAYEAYRYWKHHNRTLFGPLGGMVDREREGLVGLALAEASTLWQMSGRPMDAYGLRDCLESAALTATRIAHNVLEEQNANFEAAYGSRQRRYSTASPVVIRAETPPTMGSGFTPASYATPMSIPGRAGSGSSAGYDMSGSPYGAAATPAMPIPGAGGSPYNVTSGLPYTTSNLAGTGTSPYGQTYAGGVGSMAGAGMSGMGAGVGYGMDAGSAGMAGYGGVGGAGSYNAPSPLVGNGVPGVGMPGNSPLMGGASFGGAAGMQYPGGYQAGMAAGNPAQAAYAGNSASMYGATAAAMQQQQVPYSGAQAAYGATGYPQGQSQVQVYPPQQSYGGAGAGMSGTTIVSGGRSIPAPAGSTIVIDTKRRPRRSSHSGHRQERSHTRSRSVDPLRGERGVSFVMAGR